MNYEEALEYISKSNKFGKRENLYRMKKLMDLLENPQDKLKYVHVAGTNGKGSIVFYISNILQEANLKVGIYTSPYIYNFTERIKINKEEIKKEEVVNYISIIKNKINIMIKNNIEAPTEFEIITAMAFLHYKKLKCDIVVLEVGIGGIIDSTNIIKNTEISVIANIGYDHINLLGNTLEKIAEKKAGIIKNNGTVVLYPQKYNIYLLFKKICNEKNASLINIKKSKLHIIQSILQYQEFNYKNYKNLKIFMLGDYQIKNAIVSIEVIDFLISKNYKISEKNIREGLLKTYVPGRFEIISKKQLFILDGAHNIQGVTYLLKNLKKFFKDKKINFIVGFTKNKNYYIMLKKVFPIAKNFLVLKADKKRGVDTKEIENYIKKYNFEVIVCNSIKEAVTIALDKYKENDVICAFGSLYYLGEMKKISKLLLK